MSRLFISAIIATLVVATSAVALDAPERQAGNLSQMPDCSAFFEASLDPLASQQVVLQGISGKNISTQEVRAANKERFTDSLIFKCVNAGIDPPRKFIGAISEPSHAQAGKSLEKLGGCGVGFFSCSEDDSDDPTQNTTNLPGGEYNTSYELLLPKSYPVMAGFPIARYPCGVAIELDESRFSELVDGVTIINPTLVDTTAADIRTNIVNDEVNCSGGVYQGLKADQPYVISGPINEFKRISTSGTISLPTQSINTGLARPLTGGGAGALQPNQPFLYFPTGTALEINPPSGRSIELKFPVGVSFMAEGKEYNVTPPPTAPARVISGQLAAFDTPKPAVVRFTDAGDSVTVKIKAGTVNGIPKAINILNMELLSVGTTITIPKPAYVMPNESIMVDANEYPVKTCSFTLPPRPAGMDQMQLGSSGETTSEQLAQLGTNLRDIPGSVNIPDAEDLPNIRIPPDQVRKGIPSWATREVPLMRQLRRLIGGVKGPYNATLDNIPDISRFCDGISLDDLDIDLDLPGPL